MAAPVVLRYFPIVGRAQPLRHALVDAAVPFDDVQIPLSEWPKHKEDPAFAGPYGSLPTLGWGAVTVAETLPIASFLARRLGHYEGLDDAAIAQLEGICSSCYLEVMSRIGEILWADLLYPGVDIASAFPRQLARMLDKLGRLDRRIPEVGWLGGEKPGMADFFAAEAFEVQRYILGPEREDALHEHLPRLVALAQRVKERPAVASAWKRRPEQFTARPDEVAMVARLRALDLPLAAH